MSNLWTLFCGEAECSGCSPKPFDEAAVLVPHSSPCINHALIVSFNSLLLAILFCTLIWMAAFKRNNIPTRSQGFSQLEIISAVVNGCLGLLSFSLGISNINEKITRTRNVLPLHMWMAELFHGLALLLIGSAASLYGKHLPRASLQVLAILWFLFRGIFCASSIFASFVNGEFSGKSAINILSFIGASLLLGCAYKGLKYKDTRSHGALCMPLNDNAFQSFDFDNVAPFSKAGFFSTLSISWLNPLMKMGREKILQDEDVPKLREEDQAHSCYSHLIMQLDQHRSFEPASQSSLPSLLKMIVLCNSREIIISGLFALIKVLTLSAGPLLLENFIDVAKGKGIFKYQGYVLAILIFLVKCTETLSETQWYFRSRLIGLKMRSFLTAAIYRKLLRLSNASKNMHTAGEIVNYVTVDAYRIGEFPFWFHQTWTTSLQLCIALTILFRTVGLATIAALLTMIFTMLCNIPLAKLQQKFQTKLMAAQDERLKASSEALVHIKVLKLYAWEINFKNVIEKLRKVEYKWLSKVQLQKAYNGFIFWSSPVLVSAATFGACYLLKIPLSASSVFTFIATLRLVQEPLRSIPDVITTIIQAKVAFSRIVKFIGAPQLQSKNVQKKYNAKKVSGSISIKTAQFSWDDNMSKPTLRNINLEVEPGNTLAICGEVGSGKSTLLAAILGEVPITKGTIEVSGKAAYVSQTAWIQAGTIQENILFGSAMDVQRYEETLEKCALLEDLESLIHGDLTEIGERGVNLSGGQKQRIQLARALYQDADIYLLDDPFSSIDAQTSSSLFNEYVMGALSGKTVLLVTHHVDFLPACKAVLMMSDGEIPLAAPYHELLELSKEFDNFINAHKETAGHERPAEVNSVSCNRHEASAREIKPTFSPITYNAKGSRNEQLIKKEERETGNTGFRPYMQYLNQESGLLFFAMASICHLLFVVGQIAQNIWMAASVENHNVSSWELVVIYVLIGFTSTVFLLCRSFCLVALGLESSKSLFSKLLNSLFRAPISFYDSTPIGRILSRVSSDMNTIDLDVLFSLVYTFASSINAFVNLGVLASITMQVLFVSIPIVFLIVHMQRYHFATAKELMRINGTTKSTLANHLAESVAGAMTIRAFEEEERFFAKSLDLIDANASCFFHTFAAREWLTLRLAVLCACVLSSSALCMVLLPTGTLSPGFIGLALSYGLSLNISIVFSIQNQCTTANHIISVERLNQFMHIPSEGPEVIEGHRPSEDWPVCGKVELHDLQIRYRPELPLVLRGISCTFKAGHKIGIVGRTGSGKTTLISALFRLVEPASGKIIIDGLDISTIGLHDLRNCFGIIPQDPTLFHGSVRFNLDPFFQYSDQDIWEVLKKCQLQNAVEQKGGLNSLVMQEGSNWSMGQRQLFCLGRAILKRSRILVLDEATASIDNATDLILQKTIQAEFANCTVITVAHRIPTVMNCTKVLSIRDGELVEYDEPLKLMMMESSLFAQLVKEYWSHYYSADLY